MKTKRTGLVGLAMLLAVSISGAADDSDIMHLTDDTGERMPLQTVVPVYPKRALKDRIEGEVEVCFNVGRDGRTSRIAVRHSSSRLFEKSAMSAIRASTYQPLPANKQVSGIKTCRTFRFLLDPVAIEDPSEISGVVKP